LDKVKDTYLLTCMELLASKKESGWWEQGQMVDRGREVVWKKGLWLEPTPRDKSVYTQVVMEEEINWGKPFTF